MIYLALIFGELAGSVLTFCYVGLLVRSRHQSRHDSIMDFQREANALLKERNEISLRQLEIMEKGDSK